MDLQSRVRWESYTKAKEDMLSRTNIEEAPWYIVQGNDKKRARLAAIRTLLSGIDYDGQSDVGAADPKICGGPDIWHA